MVKFKVNVESNALKVKATASEFCLISVHFHNIRRSIIIAVTTWPERGTNNKNCRKSSQEM